MSDALAQMYGLVLEALDEASDVADYVDVYFLHKWRTREKLARISQDAAALVVQHHLALAGEA